MSEYKNNQENLNSILLAINHVFFACHREYLRDLDEVILIASLKNWTYEEIAEDIGYTHGYISDEGSKFWKRLSETIGEPISKKNLKGPIRRLMNKYKEK